MHMLKTVSLLRGPSLPPSTSPLRRMQRDPPSRLPDLVHVSAFIGQQGVKEAAEFHFSDFPWESIRADGEAAVARQHAEASTSSSVAPPPSTALPSSPRPTQSWESFHRQQNKTARFFKERRYLLLEFPELRTPGLKVLEVGAGAGSNVVPILRDNEASTVTALDISPAAIENLRQVLQNLEIDPLRCTTIACDVLSDAPLPSEAAAALQPGSYDAAVLVFTLSAVEPKQMVDLVAFIARTLKPGSKLFFRDFGLYDMTMLRFGGEHLVDGRCYRRKDGTLSYYYTPAEVASLMASAGLVPVEEPIYHTVRNANLKTKREMRRVFVHGVFQKPAAAEGSLSRS